jgi:hypothetical protein
VGDADPVEQLTRDGSQVRRREPRPGDTAAAHLHVRRAAPDDLEARRLDKSTEAGDVRHLPVRLAVELGDHR